MAGMSRGEGVKAIHTGFRDKEYDDFDEDINLLAAGPFADSEEKIPVRQWVVLEAEAGQTITVVYLDDKEETFSGPENVGIPFTSAIKTIKASTTVGRVRVTW